MKVLPWVISFLLHAGILLLLVFIRWTAMSEPEGEEIIIPIARLSETPGATLSMRTETTVTELTPQTERSTTSLTQSQSRTQAQSTLMSASDASSVSMAALGAGWGSAANTESNPFGSGVSSSSGLKATFMGTGGNARRLVYLVDASGSLIDTMPFVILELIDSVGKLSEKQDFTILFFRGEEVIEVPPAGMKRATAENKLKVNTWLNTPGNVVPRGLSTPVNALRRAMNYKPQLMFLLSDNITGSGPYEIDQNRLLRDLAKANTSGTKINTIQFLYPDPLVQYNLPGTLEMISQESGGVYKFMGARELGIQ